MLFLIYVFENVIPVSTSKVLYTGKYTYIRKKLQQQQQQQRKQSNFG